MNPRLGGLRLVGIIGNGIDADDVSPEERFFAKVVGVGLIVWGLFFAWRGQF
ncbi:hypothetical protein [Haladaptatus sp. NG-SE-30]